MARNDQVTRQWHLLRRLEGSAGLTLEELGDGLPEDSRRHLRTVRRDLDALESVGFPMVIERIAGQTRWKLLDGFRRVPALGFAPSELMALVFSRDLLRRLQGTYIHAALDSALTKASAALPPASTSSARCATSSRSAPARTKTYRAHREVIDRATRAIAERSTVQIRYLSALSGNTGRREIDPYHLWYAAGGFYLIAHWHRRRDVRMFAVERIRSLTPTDHPFQLPLGSAAAAYVQDALVVMRGRQIAVELLFDRAHRRLGAGPRRPAHRRLGAGPRLASEPGGGPVKGGKLRMTLRVADTRELAGWILSFGQGVKVVKPEALRDRVREEARRRGSIEAPTPKGAEPVGDVSAPGEARVGQPASFTESTG